MDITLAIVAIILSLLGIAGAILPGIPSSIFSYGALLCAYFCSYTEVSVMALVVWGIISIAISLFDYLLPIYFTKKFGGSKYGVNGATVGMIAGLFIFPPLGLILCPIAGAIIGELIHDKQDKKKALKVGFGSFVAFLLGNGSKMLTAAIILYIIIAKLWPTIWSAIASIF